jgi:hypothetical protein
VVKILPKFGPLATLDIKTPDVQSEKLFVESVERTVAVYHGFLEQAADPATVLADRNLDTGRHTIASEYDLADKAYAKLLKLLAKDGYAQTTPALRANMLDFYSDLDRPIETKRHKGEWREVLRDLDALKQQAASGIQGTP